MGNITGTLIQNAFQPQPDSPPLDIQEEVKKLTRDSTNRELYRLLHAEMEHGAKEKTSAAHPKTEIPENDDFGRGVVKVESPRSLGDQCRVQGGFAPHPQQQHLQTQGKDFDGNYGNTGVVAAAGSADEKKVDTGARSVTGQEESSGTPRMAFKKKILNSYRTETDDAGAPGVEKSATVDVQEKEIKREFSTCNKDSAGNSSINIDPNSLTKVLNFDSCIQVIVMNELQKLESLPSEVPSGKKLELFGILDGDSQKNKYGEIVGNETPKDRCSAESSWLSRIEKSAGQSVNPDPKRDKWPQYVPLESAPSQILAETLHPSAPRKAEVVSQSSVLLHNIPSVYQTIGHLFEPTVTQEVQRMCSSGANDGCAQSSRQVVSHLGEIAGGEVSMSRGSLAKYSHPGMWGHSQEFPGVQSSPHLLSADPGYRLTPSSQATHHLVDHHRKVDKDLESAKLARPEYISYSGPGQYPVIHHGQLQQHLSYQNSPPALPDKRHKMDAASYLYPAKMAPQERVLSQYETSSYLSQPETLQPPAMNYLKSKKSPNLAYDKELLCPLGEPQYNRAELPDMSPGSASAGSARNYRTATDPSSHFGYYGERKGRPDVQTHKRTYGAQNAEEFEFEKHFRRTAEGIQDVPVPVGTDQHVQRSFSASSFPRGRENLVRGTGGPSEETPLDLTVKKDVGGGHRANVYLLPPGARQHQPDWDMAKSVGYKLAYTREEPQVHANVYRAASQQKVVDFAVPEQVARKGEVPDTRQMYDKVPGGLTMIQPDSDFGRAILTPAQERSMRTSVVASHPFDDTASGPGPPSHVAMQRMSEALMKNQLHSVGNNWRQPTYEEMLSQGRDLLLDTDSSFRGGPERTKPRPNIQNSDMLHLSTTSPTIPHLSPIQPLAAPTGPQVHGGRRVTGPNLLGSHSPSDILHLQCKVCGSTYGSLRSFRMHFAKVHGLEPLPEHCNISTISGTKNAMSKVVPVDDNEPPALQRETLPLDVGSSGKNRTYDFDQFSNSSRSVRSNIVVSEVASVGARTKQVAEVYPMPVRVTRGFSPQLKPDPVARRPEISDAQLEQTESKTKMIDPKQGGHRVDCDLGVIRSRNCYGDLGCDVDCPECLDGFEDISDWKMHISTHMMRSCTCKVCDLSFTHSGALKKHLQTAHMPTEKVDVEYRCLFCREVFCDEKVLFQHTQEHEKKYSRVDNPRWDGGFPQSNKQHHASLDSECIQMAIPDTTSSDDVRPTSGFRENSNNLSPSTDSKGSSYGRKSFAELLVMSGQSAADADNVQKFGEIKAEDEKACWAGTADRDEKMRTGRSDSYGSAHDLTQGRTDATSLARSPGASSVVRSESSSGTEKEFRPAKAPEELVVCCVPKKQAFLKRFRSTEEKQLAEGETSRVSPSSVQSNSSRTGAAPAENSEVQQPLHLRDLFSIMGHQVEKSIYGMSDFPPVGSFVPTQRSRCVRDVCDEIIAQSFRKEKSPRGDPVSSVSVLDSSEMNASDKIKEQFRALVSMEMENQPQDVARQRCGTGGQSSAWMGSPHCLSRDSYHSLEIDESQSDRELQVEDAGKASSADSERRGLTCEFPSQESEQKNSSDPSKGRKYSVRGDGQKFGVLGGETGGSQATEFYFCNRQGGLEGSRSEGFVCRPAVSNLKESCSPTSTQKLEVCGGDSDVNPIPGSNAKTSDRVPTGCHGQKRKHFSSDASVSKEPSSFDCDTEPPAKKPTS